MLRMIERTKISNHLNVLNDIVTKLGAIGDKIEDALSLIQIF